MSVYEASMTDIPSLIDASEAPTTIQWSDSHAAKGERVLLRVGERLFRTFASTLTTESPFFADLLSERAMTMLQDYGEAIFVDADPELFEHILRYLRHGVYPLFWDRQKGFDLGLYVALQREAEFYGIAQLEHWIKHQTYTKAVRVEYQTKEIAGWEPLVETDGNIERTYHLQWITGNTKGTFHQPWIKPSEYRCPRGIEGHHGNPSSCGKACEKARNTGVSDNQKVVLRTTVIEKQTTVIPNVCFRYL